VGKDAQDVVTTLRENHHIRIAGGQEPMKGKLFRLGHMGFYDDDDIRRLVRALGETLAELDWIDPDARVAGNAAAEAVFSGEGATS
jgi:NAD-reducing hydrogenase large subunit